MAQACGQLEATRESPVKAREPGQNVPEVGKGKGEGEAPSQRGDEHPSQ